DALCAPCRGPVEAGRGLDRSAHRRGDGQQDRRDRATGTFDPARIASLFRPPRLATEKREPFFNGTMATIRSPPLNRANVEECNAEPEESHKTARWCDCRGCA